MFHNGNLSGLDQSHKVGRILNVVGLLVENNNSYVETGNSVLLDGVREVVQGADTPFHLS